MNISKLLFIKTATDAWDSDLVYNFRKSRVTVIATVITLGMITASLLAPWIAPHDPFNVATLSLLDSELPGLGRGRQSALPARYG